jgi:hypothetical protein
MLQENFPGVDVIAAVIETFVADERNRGVRLPSHDEMRTIVVRLAREMMLFEQSAGRVTAEIDCVWVISGPGTWFREKKDDRYAQYPWAAWMDRNRIERGTALVRAVTAERLSKTQDALTDEDLVQHGPRLFYNGRPDEVADLQLALGLQEAGLPREVVTVSDGFPSSAGHWQLIETTTHNVRSFLHVLGSPDVIPPRCVALVSHGPQLSRILRVMKKIAPPGLRLRLFPVPTPVPGRLEYIGRDIRSSMAAGYVLQEAALEPYSYEL